MSRLKLSTRNIYSGLINKVLNTFFPFIVRTVFISELGVSFLGLSTLFISILQVLSLAELGFSSAIIFSLYRPIIENDNKLINSIVGYYKKIYKLIGLFILIFGVSLLPFLNFFIQDNLPFDANIYLVFSLYLINSVVSYLSFSYKTGYLIAFQRNYLILNINSVVLVIQSIFQIFVLIFFKNYYLFVIILPIFTLISNYGIHLVSLKYMPIEFKDISIPKKTKDEIIKNVKGIMIFKFAAISRNAFDSILISIFIGLGAVGIYNNYYYIINSLGLFMTIFTSGIVASVGNSIASASKQKNYDLFRIINFMYISISSFVSLILFATLFDFMVIWVGEENTFSYNLVILFPIYFYLLRLGDIRGVFNEGAGLFWHQKNRSILETILNLLLNFLLAKFIGVYGIILASLITVFLFGFLYSSYITFREYFGLEKYIDYLKDNSLILMFNLLTIGIYLLASTLFNFDSLVLSLSTNLLLVITISVCTYFIIFFNNNLFKKSLTYVLKIFH